MSKTAPTRIHLINQNGRFEEGVAAATITPGHLVKLNSDGKLIPHGTAGGPAESLFALEDALQGKTIVDEYDTGDTVFYGVGVKGDVIYAFLAAGQHVTPADFLSSNGDGTLKKASGSDSRLAVPLETLNAADSPADDSRIRVRLL